MRGGGHTQPEKGFLDSIMAAHPAMFGRVTQKATLLRFQVLLSEVVEGDEGSPARLVRHKYRLDQEYFWPASAIKLCGAVAAVQKVAHLKELLGVDMNYTTPLTLFPLFEDEPEEEDDPSNLDNQNITIAHEIRKIFLVSDNAAFNRLYNFVGHHEMNRTMWSLGLLSVRLQDRLFCTSEENRFCSPVGLKLQDRTLTLPPKRSNLVVPDNSALPGVRVGSAYVTEDGQLVPEPMDFSKKNYMSLLDLQNLLVKLVRRDIELDSPPLRIGEGTRMLLMEAMSQYPADSSNPKYNKSEYPDDYCKFLLPGLSRVRSKGALRIFNKPGRAYGFTVENSYVFDIETGRSFFLSAVLYTNRNGILNDDKYEYTDVADRVLADLGEVVARAVWQIPPCVPNLSSPFDCIPSSMWAVCSCPLVQESPPAVDHHPMNTDESKGSDVEVEFSCTGATGYYDAEAKVNDLGEVHGKLALSKDVGYVGYADSAQVELSSLIETTHEFQLPTCSEPMVPSCSVKTTDLSPTGPQTYGSSFPDLPLSFHAFSSPEMQTPADQILSRLSSMTFAYSFHPVSAGNGIVDPTADAGSAHLPAPAVVVRPQHDHGLALNSEPLDQVDAYSPRKTRSLRACYRYFLDA